MLSALIQSKKRQLEGGASPNAKKQKVYKTRREIEEEKEKVCANLVISLSSFSYLS